jgi:two-component system response regulator AtoC
LEKLSRSVKKNTAAFSPDVLEMLQQYSWPGNIRQLSNVIERAILLEDGSVIGEDSIVLPDIDEETRHIPRQSGLKLSEDQQKGMICQALEDNLWIQKDAARQLGISPRALNYRIRKLGITHSRWRQNR